MRQPHLSRRAVLAGGAVIVALAGCSAPGDVPAPPPRDSPEEALARTLIAEKAKTVALYDTLIAKGGDRLVPFRDRHESHLAELRRRFPKVAAGPAASGAPTAAASPTIGPTAGPTAGPATSPTASRGTSGKVSVARLRSLERKAAALRPSQLSGISPSLAQLVASIGACEAMHALAPVTAPEPAGAGARPGDVDRLRKALAAEHAAVFAYGLLGARTTGSMRARITRAYDSHRDRRDELRKVIIARGGKPAEPAPSYALPSVPSTASAAAGLAAHVESGIVAAYLELVAAAGAETRAYAALVMQEAATRSYSFRPAITTAFPGMPGKATPQRATPTPGG
ncbi:ferritin-like domain-containing protein [Nonomuraea sp. NPDC049714]|uniref:ferritin-like domain-containing protein n=1 Tax=Nonomuraea sp. NPDC049714 TaxID=3364357 RepID=UPI0037B7715B